MKTFYLLRHEDVHGNSGIGVVAEGVIFYDGTGAFTWLSEDKTVTTFQSIRSIRKLHSHGGKTEVVIEDVKGQKQKFEQCKEESHKKKIELKTKKEKR
jgi:hypothetical protein